MYQTTIVSSLAEPLWGSMVRVVIGPIQLRILCTCVGHVFESMEDFKGSISPVLCYACGSVFTVDDYLTKGRDIVCLDKKPNRQARHDGPPKESDKLSVRR